ncbi:hypothetical protein A0O36_02762 [Piscirickettsiaceae bacterium NZ-RLO1]|nr:hypothetical protein A0O36_02762 [Piscirickettsiaceae bacterium NZ-RLO1]
MAQHSLADLYKTHYLAKDSVTALDVKFSQLDSIFGEQVKWGLSEKKPSQQKDQAEKIAQEIVKLSKKIVRSFEDKSKKFYKECRWVEVTKLKLSENYIDKVLASPQQFLEHYQCLEKIGLNKQAAIVQQVLDNPKFFEQVYLTLNLDVEDLRPLKDYIEKALAGPELFAKSYDYLKEFGLHQFKYINLLLNDFDEFKQSCEYLDECQLGQSVSYIKEIILHPKLLAQGYERLKALELNQPEYIEKLLSNLALFAENYQRLENIGFNLNAECVQKMLDYPEIFDRDYPSLQKLHVVYKELTTKIESNQFKVHGLTGGSPIMFKGQLRCVPKGVSKIWEQMTDDEGNFKWMDDADAALTQAKAQADQRQGFRGLTVVSIFFGSYRDSEAKALYKEISGLLAS